MRIQLNHALFDAEQVDPADLLQLILLCRRPSAHFVALNPVWDPKTDNPINRWLVFWPQAVQKTLRTILSDTTESARRGRALTIVVQSEHSDWDPPPGKGLRLNVADALAMARTPLHVLVENRRNDGRFIARFAIMLETNEDRTLFKRALCDGWFVFEQGGGLQEVQHLLKDLHTQNKDPVLCPSRKQCDVRRWRLFVVTDRDALAVKAKPRDASAPSGESTRVQQAAENVLHAWNSRPAFHQLRRRSIENYIPLRSLEKWVQESSEKKERELRRTQYEAFRVLDTADTNGNRPRWYFNMKKGLDGDKPNGLETVPTSDEHVHAMFHVLTEKQRVELQKGFNTKIADLLFDRELTPDDWLREELSLDDVSLDDADATNFLNDLLNRL